MTGHCLNATLRCEATRATIYNRREQSSEGNSASLVKGLQQVERAIDEFFRRYDNTLDLLQRFLASKSNRQEFVLLSCARLDSLANLACAEGTQQSRFSRFLAKYSGLGKQTFTWERPGQASSAFPSSDFRACDLW